MGIPKNRGFVPGWDVVKPCVIGMDSEDFEKKLGFRELGSYALQENRNARDMIVQFDKCSIAAMLHESIGISSAHSPAFVCTVRISRPARPGMLLLGRGRHPYGVTLCV